MNSHLEKHPERATIAVIVGTRPEAIKMAPVVSALQRSPTLAPWLVSTGQHRELMQLALAPFGLQPESDLAVMAEGQSLSGVLARVVDGLDALFSARRPAAVLVQGDTTTVLGAAIAAYHLRIPVGHVEAGLRTYNHDHPFPEEANRQLVARLSRWCFAPTELSKSNLLAEVIPAERVVVTGNTVVDALIAAIGKSTYKCPANCILITLHRRESFGGALTQILLGVRDFLEATPTACALWPVHPNPSVAQAQKEVFRDTDNISCVAPLDYLEFSGALLSCRVVLTDSGGLQEEGPALGKRVLVARETTERPEGLATGLTRLVGRSRSRVYEELLQAFSAAPYDGPIPAPSPFGDGQASERIVRILESDLVQR